MTTKHHFLDLIRFAMMGSRPPVHKLSREEWTEVIGFAKQQAVAGLVYAAAEQLPSDYRPARDDLLKLFAYIVRIESGNHKLNKRLCSLFEIYEKMGSNPMLLKGQGVGMCYPKPLWRNPGDIDVFLTRNFEEVHRWVDKNGDGVQDYEPDHDKHVHFQWQSVTVENHFLLARFYDGETDRRMQTITREGLEMEESLVVTIEGMDIPLLPPTLGLLHLITHFSHHLMDWGIGIRQLCDIVMYIHTYHKVINRTILNCWLGELHLERSAGALASVGIRHLGLPADEVPIDTKAGERYADKLLALVMDSGNFGCIELGDSPRSLLWRTQFYVRHCIKSYSLMPKEVRASFAGKVRHIIHRLKKGDTNI